MMDCNSFSSSAGWEKLQVEHVKMKNINMKFFNGIFKVAAGL